MPNGRQQAWLRERTSPFLTAPARPREFRGVPVSYGPTSNLAPAETASEGIVIDPTQVSRGGLPGTLAHEYGHAFRQGLAGQQNAAQWLTSFVDRAGSGRGTAPDFLGAWAQGAAYSLLPGGPAPQLDPRKLGQAYADINEAVPYAIAGGSQPGLIGSAGRALRSTLYRGLPGEREVRAEIDRKLPGVTTPRPMVNTAQAMPAFRQLARLAGRPKQGPPSGWR